MTSPRIAFDDYLARYSHEALSAGDVISIMVGDLQRVRLYPGKGFQIPQDIPDEVWAAFEALVGGGLEGHLLSACRL